MNENHHAAGEPVRLGVFERFDVIENLHRHDARAARNIAADQSARRSFSGDGIERRTDHDRRAAPLQRLKLSIDGYVARVTLDRPDVRTAFDDATIVELTAAFRALNDDANVRVIVLAANGPAFYAGADLTTT